MTVTEDEFYLGDAVVVGLEAQKQRFYLRTIDGNNQLIYLDYAVADRLVDILSEVTETIKNINELVKKDDGND